MSLSCSEKNEHLDLAKITHYLQRDRARRRGGGGGVSLRPHPLYYHRAELKLSNIHHRAELNRLTQRANQHTGTSKMKGVNNE